MKTVLDDLKSYELTLTGVNMAQSRPLWRLLAMSGATQTRNDDNDNVKFYTMQMSQIFIWSHYNNCHIFNIYHVTKKTLFDNCKETHCYVTSILSALITISKSSNNATK